MNDLVIETNGATNVTSLREAAGVVFPALTNKTDFDAVAEPIYMANAETGRAQKIDASIGRVIRRTDTAEALGVDSKIRSTTQTIVERRLRGSRISNSQYMATSDGKVQGWVEIEFPLGSANQLIYDTIQQDQAMSQEARRSEAFKELIKDTFNIRVKGSD